MNYIDADKLLAEIERRKNESREIAQEHKNSPLGNAAQTMANEDEEILSLIDSLQQEEPDTKEQSSHLEHWLAFFGCPEENIEKCATQIAQGYGAIRYLEGVQRGAEAVNELAQQEQPEVDLEKELDRYLRGEFQQTAGGNFNNYIQVARHFYGLRNRALEEAARHVYESWMGGTMDDVRRDMIELGRVINARKEGLSICQNIKK